ncbi:putative oxidoreductase YvaA [Poriferisphaera corsica]|uniref:Putative oxidoreductase YvaA n=1 Tax=Poriferisphaera corsica TaxID=2528020 RepID=A0A517YWG1_9BACT|nr:Gfo/Idh/MocA family oxidoreductase [Poriferisphaera corsica]QDU34565.1 putative oxidoreductase YvaA [Poriferisphaera corsica]
MNCASNHDYDRPIRVGIAGLGRSGWHIHAMAMDAVGQEKYEICAVFDLDTARSQEAVDKFSAVACESYEELARFEGIDLIVVATPNHLHAEHAMKALQHGKHVVIEKPLGCSVAEVLPVIAYANKKGLICAPYQNRRYDPHFLKVMEIVKSGVLGRVFQINMTVHAFTRRWDWQTLKEFGGGMLNNTGAHFADQAIQFIDGDNLDVFCHFDRALSMGDADDHAMIMMRSPGNPFVMLELSSACAKASDLWLVMGDRGTLWGNMNELHWKTTNFDELPEHEVLRTPTENRWYQFEEVPWEEHHWKLEGDEAKPTWTLEKYYVDLYATIRQGSQLYVSPESVIRQMRVLEQARDSAEAFWSKANLKPVQLNA